MKEEILNVITKKEINLIENEIKMEIQRKESLLDSDVVSE